MESPYASPLSSLFDLAVEIERHHNDLTFVRNGGRIIYVFDEIIFELFVYPFEKRRLSQVHLGDSALQAKTKLTHGMMSALALVTAEALFSDCLPGQQAEPVYLTSAHREELLDRMNEVLGQAFNLRQRSVEVAEALRAKQRLHETTTTNTKSNPISREFSHTRDDPYLASDIAELRATGKLRPETLDLFEATRRAAVSLSKEVFLEPIRQLARILEPPRQEKIRGLASLRQPSAGDEPVLRQRKVFWRKEIDREIRHQRYLHSPRTKSGRPAENDAESLAFVEWVSRQLNPVKERIVLVTGDSTLLNAYRRVADRSMSASAGRHDPFLLRTPVQYSPIFNLDTEHQNIVDAQNLFTSIRQVLDVSLVSYQVAELAGQKAERGVEGRPLADLQGHTLEPLRTSPRNADEPRRPLNRVDKFWHEQVSGGNHELTSLLTEIAEKWRKSERIVMGLASSAVAIRISDEEKRFFEDLRGAAEPDQEGLILQYVTTLVTKLARSALEVWKPVARKFFEKAVVRRQRFESRVPLAIKLAISDGHRSIDLVKHLTNDRAEGTASDVDASEIGVEFLQNPFELFMAACVLALIKGQWRLAVHFSDMASTSFEFQRGQDSVTEIRATEAYYASALARRIRLGQIDVRNDFDGPDIVYQFYVAARDSLENVRRYGTSLRLLRAGDVYQQFRNFRLASECAALELFMASQLFIYDHTREGQIAQACKHLRTARLSLLECAAIQSNVTPRFFHVTSSDDAVALVTRQFLINIAAWNVLSYLVDPQYTLDMTDVLVGEFVTAEADLLTAMAGKLSPLFQSEIYAFAILCRRDVTRNKSMLATLSVSGGDSLPIDQHLTRLIKDSLAGPLR